MIVSFSTWPETFASAFIEQIISSRQPLPWRVFEMPMW
jgi:hypothetical protein